MFPGIVTVTLVLNFKQTCLQVTFTFRDIKKKNILAKYVFTSSKGHWTASKLIAKIVIINT